MFFLVFSFFEIIIIYEHLKNYRINVDKTLRTFGEDTTANDSTKTMMNTRDFKERKQIRLYLGGRNDNGKREILL